MIDEWLMASILLLIIREFSTGTVMPVPFQRWGLLVSGSITSPYLNSQFSMQVVLKYLVNILDFNFYYRY